MKPCAKSLVLDLLVAKNGAPLHVREAITACDLFGISANNVRVTLARLTTDALLEGAGRGSYQLGPRAIDLSTQLFEWRNLDQQLRPWSGSYLMVACNALARSDRRVLRQRERALHMLGFAELEKDLYVRPNNLEPGVEILQRRLIELGMEPAALVFQAMGFDDEQTHRIQGLWDLMTLNDSYRRHCERLNSWSSHAEQLGVDQAARESFHLGREAIRQVVFDPLLPPPLVDVELRDEFFACARRFVDHGHQIWRAFLQQAPTVN
jgi:phenylacetic acid degradation operon negative regulatory protein